MRLGLDLGTTRTVVAVADRGNYPVIGFDGPDGADLDHYPSLVAADDRRLYFGLDALERAASQDAPVLRSFKRLLSGPRVSPDAPVRIGAHEVGLLDLITRFLAALREDLYTRAHLRPEPGARLQAVIATPANAHSAQRLITLEAAKQAGFEVLAMMNEPSAAGVEYAHRHARTLTANRQDIVVYDLGGGTFDASTVRLGQDRYEVTDARGIARLGGDDFDRVLLDLALTEVGVPFDAFGPVLQTRLLEHCRVQKERLHPSSRRVSVELGAQLTDAEAARFGVSPSATVTLGVDDYYEACVPLVARTMEVLGRVLPGDLEDETLDTLAGVYVVGGASALPVVARMLREWFGRRVRRSPYPSASTAIGLAIAADAERDVQVCERFARSFGVFREAQGGAEIAFDPLVDRNVEVPRAGRVTELVRRYRAAHNLGHFRYVECGWLEEGQPAGDITPYAEIRFPFDPALQSRAAALDEVSVHRTPELGARIEERYAIDPGGSVRVTITDLDTGYRREHRLHSA